MTQKRMTKQYKIEAYESDLNGHFCTRYKIYSKPKLTKIDFTWFIINWTLSIGSFGIYYLLYLLFTLVKIQITNKVGDPFKSYLLPLKDWELLYYADELDEAIAKVEQLRSIENEVYYL